MKGITASALPRLSHCVAGAVLPQVREETARSSRGTELHRFMERASEVGRATALDEVSDELRPLCEALPLESLPVDPSAYAAEVALALDLETGEARELGRGLNRAYQQAGLRPTEAPGTADVVALVEPDAVYVGDWKFGYQQRSTDPAERNLQLGFLALAMATLHGRYAAVVELIHIRDDGTPWRDRAELDTFGLALIREQVREIASKVEQARAVVEAGRVPDTSRGPWCRYCPAFASCPAQAQLVRQVTSSPEDVTEDLLAMLTPERAAAAYERLRQVREVLKRVDSALYAYALEHPIPLGDGVVLGPVETSREDVDGEVARRVLVEQYGPAVADLAVEWTATKKSLERGVRQVHKEFAATCEGPVTLKSVREEVLGEIRKAGGITRHTKTTVKEHRAALTAGGER